MTEETDRKKLTSLRKAVALLPEDVRLGYGKIRKLVLNDRVEFRCVRRVPSSGDMQKNARMYVSPERLEYAVCEFLLSGGDLRETTKRNLNPRYRALAEARRKEAAV